MQIGSFANSESIQEHLNALGIEDRNSEEFKSIFSFLDKLIEFENYSKDVSLSPIEAAAGEKIKNNLHKAICDVIEKNIDVQVNSFKAAIKAIDKFNSPNTLAPVLANSFSSKPVSENNALDQDQAQKFRYEEIQTKYSQYLSQIGLEPIMDFDKFIIPPNPQIPNDLQNFFNTVRSIWDLDSYQITNPQESELKNYIEELKDDMDDTDNSSISPRDYLVRKLIEYFYQNYATSDSGLSLSTDNLTLIPSHLKLNIKDGGKVLKFLEKLKLPVDKVLIRALEKIQTFLALSCEDPFFKKMNSESKQKKIDCVYSSSHLFDQINKQLKRLGLASDKLDDYIRHAKDKTLPEYIIILFYKLSDDFYGSEIAYSTTNEKDPYSYQAWIRFLKNGMIKLQSSNRGKEFYQQCHEKHIKSLTEAIRQMNDYLDDKPTEWFGNQDKPTIIRKLEIAQSALEWLNENKL